MWRARSCSLLRMRNQKDECLSAVACIVLAVTVYIYILVNLCAKTNGGFAMEFMNSVLD